MAISSESMPLVSFREQISAMTEATADSDWDHMIDARTVNVRGTTQLTSAANS